MNILTTYREDKTSRINAVVSVIKVAKEVADQYFETSEYADMTSAKTLHEINADRAEVANFLTNCKGHYLSLLSKACNAVFSKVEESSLTITLTLLYNVLIFVKCSHCLHRFQRWILLLETKKLLRPLLPEIRVQKILVLAHPFDKSSVQTALYEAYLELLHYVNGTTGSAVGLI